MNWAAIGAIGELIGAAAVVVTLVFLAVQIRQNSKNIEESLKLIKAQTKQMTTAQSSDFTKTLLENPNLAMVFQRGALSNDVSSELNEVDRRLFHSLMLRAMLMFNDDHFRRASGMTSDLEWEDSIRIFKISYLTRPGFVQWWRSGTIPGASGRDYFGNRFQNFVEDELSKIEVDDT